MKMEAIKALEAYEIVESHFMEDLNSQGILLKHKKTGARVTLISNDDENKVFYIGFRTPPTDSTGVAHIVEHTVLCGSKDFPVKDPFIELAKGSLNTFLNAMTFPDKTVYPVASCNGQDFQNLMHVYLDAVFYPNIYKEKRIFQQEGWHYELENAEDELTINGVVYSEMKGAFSSPDDLLEREIMNSLYPDNAYGVESGGHPDAIPDLTYEDYLAFHGKYYHPSNSYIYLYGDMDMAEKLTFIDREYLSHFEARHVESEVKRQERFDSPKETEIFYPISDSESEEGNAYLSYNVMTADSVDRECYVAFGILDYVIFSAPGAPVRQALIDAGIGKDVYSTYENGIMQSYVSVIAKNADASQKDRFVEIIETELKKLVENGLDKRALQAAISRHEFRYREADFGSYPKGLIYGLNVLDSWLYDDKLPFCHIEAGETFRLMKERVESNYFEELIVKYLLNNTHRTVVVASPKKGLTEEKEKQLAKQLAQTKAGMSKEVLDTIIRETKALKEYHEIPDSKEDLEKIPLLCREDIEKKAKAYENEEDCVDGSLFLKHDVFTNGIGYVRLAFKVNNISDELLPYLGILQNYLGYLDTKNYKYADLYHEINLLTGGISSGAHIYETLDKPEEPQLYFEVKTKVLYENMAKAFELMEEILFTTSFEDTKRVHEILSEVISRMQSRLMSAGHSAAAARTLSYFVNAMEVGDRVQGLDFFWYMDELEKNFDERKDEFVSSLKKLVKHIFRPENVMLDYTSPKDQEAGIREAFSAFKKKLYTEPVALSEYTMHPVKKNEGFTNSAKVQYVCRGGNYLKAGEEYSGSFKVLRTILGYDYLWNNVRVEGGAYGCMSAFRWDGTGYFVSYRDPNLSRTNEVFEKVVDYLENFDADERTMTQFIIGTVSDEDIPLTPSARGSRSYNAYLSGRTIERTQKERDELLSTTADTIRGFAPCMKSLLDTGCICVVGNTTAIEEAADLFGEIKPLFRG